jgi:hypothetical protein
VLGDVVEHRCATDDHPLPLSFLPSPAHPFAKHTPGDLTDKRNRGCLAQALFNRFVQRNLHGTSKPALAVLHECNMASRLIPKTPNHGLTRPQLSQSVMVITDS